MTNLPATWSRTCFREGVAYDEEGISDAVTPNGLWLADPVSCQLACQMDSTCEKFTWKAIGKVSGCYKFSSAADLYPVNVTEIGRTVSGFKFCAPASANSEVNKELDLNQTVVPVTVVGNVDEGSSSYWWVWALIGLGIIALSVVLCCLLFGRKTKKPRKSNKRSAKEFGPVELESAPLINNTVSGPLTNIPSAPTILVTSPSGIVSTAAQPTGGYTLAQGSMTQMQPQQAYTMVMTSTGSARQPQFMS